VNPLRRNPDVPPRRITPLAPGAVGHISNAEAAVRLRQLGERLEHMRATLSGCDWCCGGGDEEWAALSDEADSIMRRFPKLRASFEEYEL